MYTVSDELAALITSPCRTWRILLEDLTTARTLTAEAIFTANSDRESTSLSDDIELGAVCSQSWTVNIADGEPIPMGVCLTRWRGSDASFALRAKHAISLTRYRKTSHGVGLERER